MTLWCRFYYDEIVPALIAVIRGEVERAYIEGELAKWWVYLCG